MRLAPIHLIRTVAPFALLAGVGLWTRPEPEPHRAMVRVEQPAGAIPNQNVVSNVACGPTSALIALATGAPAARKEAAKLVADGNKAALESLIARFGQRTSEDYGKGPRFRKGISAMDLTAFVNDIRAELELAPLAGSYMSKTEGESPLAHLGRIHGYLTRSLAKGEPVILHIRTFYAGPENDKAKKPTWNGLASHFVVATGVPTELSPGARGFAVEILDPNGGMATELYLAAESVRAFVAAEGNAEKWEWKPNSPFLTCRAPSLALDRQSRPWNERTLCVLHHMTGAW